MSETPPSPKPEYPTHMESAPAGLFEHWCDHKDCKAWGSFGFTGRYGISWYCGEHKSNGNG